MTNFQTNEAAFDGNVCSSHTFAERSSFFCTVEAARVPSAALYPSDEAGTEEVR
jgi:hypothetical protein